MFYGEQKVVMVMKLGIDSWAKARLEYGITTLW